MPIRCLKLGLLFVFVQILVVLAIGHGQEAAPADEPPPVPQGVEVLARGPVHEAFASLAGEPIATKAVPKRPPKPLDELPPAEKPEGEVVWMGGYWAWDDERKDYLWVSGIWRTPPPHKQWIAGYWREEGEQWQWVPGFWTETTEQEQETKQVAYLPKPPDPPEVAPPGQPPAADTFYVPGSWTWSPQTSAYAWRAGYWARVQPGYVWVPNHYRWTPAGYIFIPGYWDLAVSRRGVLYAPVAVNPAVMTVGFSYSPAYVVSDTVVVDALFVRPMYGHYYFGDYYGPAYATMGFESVFVYGGRRYDSIIVYETWAHRNQPNWVSLQIDIFNGRSRGVLPVPPRTAVLAPTAKALAAKGLRTVALDRAMREQVRQHAAAVRQAAIQRSTMERPLPPGASRQAHMASLSVPKAPSNQPSRGHPQQAPARRPPPNEEKKHSKEEKRHY